MHILREAYCLLPRKFYAFKMSLPTAVVLQCSFWQHSLYKNLSFFFDHRNATNESGHESGKKKKFLFTGSKGDLDREMNGHASRSTNDIQSCTRKVYTSRSRSLCTCCAVLQVLPDVDLSFLPHV